MTDDEVRAAARRVVVSLILDHPREASVVAAMVLSEILAIALYAEGRVDPAPADDSGVEEFVAAVNGKLGEIARAHNAKAWRFVPAD